MGPGTLGCITTIDDAIILFARAGARADLERNSNRLANAGERKILSIITADIIKPLVYSTVKATRTIVPVKMIWLSLNLILILILKLDVKGRGEGVEIVVIMCQKLTRGKITTINVDVGVGVKNGALARDRVWIYSCHKAIATCLRAMAAKKRRIYWRL
jgi:hypothetical protein